MAAIPLNSRVRLRDDIDPAFYGGFSRTGNEGWLRKRKHDEYGYPQVLVEWDENHWAYNGAPDGWTWENHFEPIEETAALMANKKKQLDKVMDEFTKALSAILSGEDESDESEEVEGHIGMPEEPEDKQVKFEEVRDIAKERLDSAKAFLVIALQENEEADDPGAPDVLFPMIFQGTEKPEYSLIVQSQLPHIMAMLNDHLYEKEYTRIREQGNDES